MNTHDIDISRVLIDRCKNGDSRAQHELYRFYAKMIYNVCLRITGHEGEAEDLLQETFLDAFNNIGKFRNDTMPGAWLKRIAVNKSINSLRKKRLVLFDELPGIANITDDSYADDDNTAWEVKEVKRIINELPEGYRLVLNLYLMEGYDHAEIAQILNISETTSKTQYSRAKARVREQLNVKSHERQV